MQTQMSFPYGSETLAATLFFPESATGPVPAVVGASGFGGVKEMMLPAFARALAKAGIAAMIFDYAGFGESSGDVRQHIDVVEQVAQMAEALEFLAADERFDSDRLGVWGPSLAGGHVLKLAAGNERVACSVAIIPFISSSEDGAANEIVTAVFDDAARREAGGDPGHIPAVGRPGDLAVMTSDGAWEWSAHMTAQAPNFRNTVTLASLLDVSSYRPAENLADVKGPLRVILATDDTITPAQLVRSALADVPDVDFVEFPDSHFELFDANLDAVVASTVGWFSDNL